MKNNVQDPLKQLADICQPDARQSNFLDNLADTHADLSSMALHDGVPFDVRQLFETAKNVSLYAWFVYRFHQVSELAAFSSLELALRLKAGFPDLADGIKPPMLSELLGLAQRERWFSNERFPCRETMAIDKAIDRRLRTQLPLTGDKGVRHIPVPTMEEVALAMEDTDVVQLLRNL